MINRSPKLTRREFLRLLAIGGGGLALACLLYTSDAADERSSVDLGGRRIIKKKTNARARGRRRM